MLRVKLLSTGVVISLTAEPSLKTFLTWILGKEFRRKTVRKRTSPVCECGLLGGEEPFKCPSAGWVSKKFSGNCWILLWNGFLKDPPYLQHESLG